jgi:hypothetical protein
MPVSLKSTGGGSVALEAPNTASNRTLTLPDNTGTLISTASTFAGTGPAFSVWRSGGQSISATTYTKIQFNTEEYDTANCFDSTTNYRFTPNVAGYYQINAAWQATGAIGAAGQTGILIYKNGSAFKWGMLAGLSSGGNYSAVVSSLVYCNGTTDYIEIYAYIGNANTISGNQTDTYANGFLARAA